MLNARSRSADEPDLAGGLEIVDVPAIGLAAAGKLAVGERLEDASGMAERANGALLVSLFICVETSVAGMIVLLSDGATFALTIFFGVGFDISFFAFCIVFRRSAAIGSVNDF